MPAFKAEPSKDRTWWAVRLPNGKFYHNAAEKPVTMLWCATWFESPAIARRVVKGGVPVPVTSWRLDFTASSHKY